MRRRLLLVLLAWATVAGAASAQSSRSAPPSAPTSAREWADAQCVAALDAQTEALAQQVKAGQADLKGLLRARLKAGAAFIGRAWLDGERDEDRSHALLDKARAAQRGLSGPELSQRQTRCAAEGERLLAEANAFSRAVVSKLADRRMKRLLEG